MASWQGAYAVGLRIILDTPKTVVSNLNTTLHIVLLNVQKPSQLRGSKMSSSASTEAILEIVKSMQTSRMVTYSQMSSIAFLIYDIIIMFHKEVEYVWKSAWSFPKMLYLFARYYALLYVIHMFVVNNIVGLPIKAQFCKTWYLAKVLLGEILFTTVVNVILVMRLNAMYGKKVKVLAFLVFLVIVEFALELFCSFVSAKKASETTFTAPFGLPWPGCFSRPNVMFTLTTWIPTTLIATIFFVMTMAKLFEDGRWRPSRMRTMSQVSPLLVSFFRDGAVFFFLIFPVLVASTVMYVLGTGILGEILGCWLICVYSFAACRLIINLREAAARGNASTSLQKSMSLSTWQGHIVSPERSGSTMELTSQ
ncbi:uncharacterized protein EV420DRAFT_1771282 [Desarmillaria tabescens]|uniref:DUF6533 domain-containing protein n=1 Tax=Armillaria tabescens TaxID=1929756 RepID=A0AA39J1T8_ARMTA|nr:uncharacterized protein EV420DRAFT_1771282 [Desarmillaria tabescens]KAK0433920.1 hypothetical protein EV420DRAFT_1771282 [Desarmillaria tabescens]